MEEGEAKRAPEALRRAFRFAAERPLAVALGLSAFWLVVVAAYAVGFYADGAAPPRPAAALEAALFLLAAILPPALFVLGALLARRAEALRRETARLSGLLEAGRRAPGPLVEGGAAPPALDPEALAASLREAAAPDRAALEKRLAAIEAGLAESRDFIARIEGRESAARREAKLTHAPPAADAAQPALPLAAETAEPAGGLRWTSVVRALDFPKDKSDKAGFAALRAALKEPDFAELLQAAEDVLTLFSEDGLYMEDIAAPPATAADWRRYAGGARGAEAEACGGVTDEVALALVRARMRSDAVFRDGALHFIRRFDRFMRRMIAELGEDPLVVEAADTRSGRAFQILARVTGAFG